MSPRFRNFHRTSVLALLALACAPGLALAQKIVKWTDANGQVHYSDHAPTDQNAVAVNVPKSPPPPPPKPKPVVPVQTDEDAALNAQADAAHQKYLADEAARKKQYADDKKRQEDWQKKYDQSVVDRCKANHETYCNKGAKGIQDEEWLRGVKQKQAAQRSYDSALRQGYNPGNRPR